VLVDSREESATAFGVGAGLVITPGLNLVAPATWAAAEANEQVTKRRKANLLTPVDIATLDADALRELIGRTLDADALRFILAVELAKPVTAGPNRRRNPAIVDAAKRQLKKAPKPKR
jgi:hypothetical protein